MKNAAIFSLCVLLWSSPAMTLAAPADGESFGGWYPHERDATKTIAGTRYPKRNGTTPEGYSYEISPDGGQLRTPRQLWGVSCNVDAMDDKKRCTIVIIDDARFSLYFDENMNSTGGCLATKRFEQSPGMVRVDKNPARRTDRDGCLASDIIKEIEPGQTLLTRTDEVGPDGATDHELSLDGYSKAVEFMKFIASRTTGQ